MRYTINNAMVSDMIATALKGGVMCGASWQYGVLRHRPVLKENAHSRNYGPFKTKNKKHMAKVAKNIQIEVFSTTYLTVLVEWATPGLPVQRLHISRCAFEQWLYETCRLDWCLTEIHATDPHYNNAGADNWPYAQYGVSMAELVTYLLMG